MAQQELKRSCHYFPEPWCCKLQCKKRKKKRLSGIILQKWCMWERPVQKWHLRLKVHVCCLRSVSTDQPIGETGGLAYAPWCALGDEAAGDLGRRGNCRWTLQLNGFHTVGRQPRWGPAVRSVRRCRQSQPRLMPCYFNLYLICWRLIIQWSSF